MKGLWLNIGSSSLQWPGFINLDRVALPGVTVCDARLGLPFGDASVDGIVCLPGDEPVNTPSGFRAIGTLRVGDVVLGASGPTRVTRVLSRRYAGPLYRVYTAEGVTVCTEEHPILTPQGWTKGDQLRPGSVVYTAKREYAHEANNLQITRRVRARLPLGAAVLGAAVVERDSAQTEFAHQRGYAALRAAKERARALNYRQHVVQAPNGNRPRAFRLGGLLTPCSALNGERDSQPANDTARRGDDSRVGVCEIKQRDYLLGCKAERDAALTVDEPCEPSTVLRVDVLSHVGIVINLSTESETFFAGNVLTHNCSHMLEHLHPFKEAPGFLRDVKRVLKPGGVLRVAVPDLEKLVIAYMNPESEKARALSESQKYLGDSLGVAYESMPPALRLSVIAFGNNSGAPAYDGHQVCFDAAALKWLLVDVTGFERFSVCEGGASRSEELRTGYKDTGAAEEIVVEVSKGA